MRHIVAALLSLPFFMGVAAAAPAVIELPATPLTIGKAKLIAEVAATPDQRTTGLMHRFSLKPDHGMIFVFDRAEPLSFYMRNTYIPLSIAFIGSDGRIINIADMAPRDESLHWSSGPAQYALEMRKGWFADRGIQPGDRVEGLPAVRQ
jgi:uncharacterized membrane protein (UPF0127 family)